MHQQPSPHTSWKVLVFHVADEAHQQEILQTFRGITDLDIVALGTRREDDHFVVIDCPTSVAQVVAQGVVGSIDPHASVSFISQLQPVATS